MITRKDLTRLDEFVWEIPADFREDMRVPARIYADSVLLEDALEDRSVEQLVNTASLPGLLNYVIAMPDIHQGYGFPIGGVAATELPDGVVSPGGVGFDINCGVRMLASHLTEDQVRPCIRELATSLYKNCPSGVGVSGSVRLHGDELEDVLNHGAKWALKRGFASHDDLQRTEEFGVLEDADAVRVSNRAKERGRNQLGTLGAGNHFVEVDRVAAIYDETAADVLGLFPDQIVVQVHCGSRGLGHQVCQDYVDRFQSVVHEYRIELPDRELVCAPYSSTAGREYAQAMAAAANFAFANRQVLAYHIRRSFEETLAGQVTDFDLDQVYDIAHNMAKVEEHIVNGEKKRVLVHRKGATRAFGPGSPNLPDDLRQVGQPVLIPGSMGTASFILVGTMGAMEQTFGSTCHGAGRVMSRAKARRQVRGEELRSRLEGRGIAVRAGSLGGLSEEAPEAYKDVARVVEVVEKAGIGKRVARLEPLAVIKG